MKILVMILMGFGFSLFAINAQATQFKYSCLSSYWNGYDLEKGTMIIQVGPEAAWASIKADLPEETHERIGGSIDKNFKNKDTKIKYFKFGSNLYVQQGMTQGGEIINSSGQIGGVVKFEGKDSQGQLFQYRFICDRVQ